MDQLITTIDCSPTVNVVFSLRVYRGVKYIALTKFLSGKNDIKPKPIGGVVFTPDVFLQINTIITEHTGDLLDANIKLIDTVASKEGEEVQISISEYNGVVGIDIRKYLILGDIKKPTKSGVRFPIEEVDSIAECFDKVTKLL